ncbi:TetR family transcriptional regulator [Falsochrobactrum ovis]|uniref:TetR family transcriptional regulator n=1 Tax=Falsochrobactrum ovis TaxID=1293442 RepID=A0A364JRI1_9HYPH|nr:TetR family transcriptional regulator [Falsochrobactrum ovis]RAK24745.1 TetR family transcriptional regulator [Falsochrobactrum ovis]
MRRTRAEAAETREEILSCAERIFFEKGVAHTSLEEIATAAGVTRGAIYWHFQNKTDIFLELFDAIRLPHFNLADLDGADGQFKDPLIFLEQIVGDWLDKFVVDEQRQRLLTILVRTNFSDGFEEVLAAKEAFEQEQMQVPLASMKKAESLGMLVSPWNAHSAATAFRWLMKGMVWEWLLSSCCFDLSSQGKQVLKTFLTTLRKPEQQAT